MPRVEPSLFRNSDYSLPQLVDGSVPVFRTKDSEPIWPMEFSVLPLDEIDQIIYHYRLHPHEGFMLIISKDGNCILTKLAHGGHGGPLSVRTGDLKEVLISRFDEPFRTHRFNSTEDCKWFFDNLNAEALSSTEKGYLAKLREIFPEVDIRLVAY